MPREDVREQGDRSAFRSVMTDDRDGQERFEIDWTRAVAGSLAAVASAVLLSTLGAAGTVLGAAIGSLVVTIGSAMFAQGLSSSKRTLAGKQKAAEKVDSAQAEVLRASRVDDPAAQASHLDQADEHLADAREQLEEAIEVASPVSLRERLSRLPWGRMALTALALFVVSLLLITAFELVAGRSVSSITGGSDSGDTTIEQVGGGSGGGDQDPQDQPTGSTSPSETVEESAQPTQSASPSETPQPSPAGSTAPTASPTTTPLATPAPTSAPTTTP